MCKVDGCDKKVYGHGMCSMHYTRWRKTLMPECAVSECSNSAVNLVPGLCPKHYTRLRETGTTDSPQIPVEERFWALVNKTDTCWLWKGGTSRGYGLFMLPSRKQIYVHRYAYELLVGPIPPGLRLDHIWPQCTSTLCVRAPDHLEPVTTAENNRRAAAKITHCPQGHEYTKDNTALRGPDSAWRACRTCERNRTERQRQQLRSSSQLPT